MKTVRVKKSNLLGTVRKNREEHIKSFEKAMEGFLIEADTALKKAQKKLRSIIGPPFMESAYSGLHVNISAPDNHTQDYDRAISMLEMSVDDVIEIEEDEFAKYALDQWDWKHSWASSNALYMSSAMKLKKGS